MKKIKSLILTIFLSLNLYAITEGVEYNVLENPIPNANNSLTEVWSYQCSHCYLHFAYGTVDAVVNEIKDININMMMVKSWGEFGKQMGNLLAYAKYEDEKNKQPLYSKDSLYYNISNNYFIDLFKNGEDWDKNENKFYKMGLDILGISKRKLDKFISSPEGEYLIKSTDIADEIANMVGTPAFVVNGKYVINLAHAKSPQELINIIKELLKHKEL